MKSSVASFQTANAAASEFTEVNTKNSTTPKGHPGVEI